MYEPLSRSIWTDSGESKLATEKCSTFCASPQLSNVFLGYLSLHFPSLILIKVVSTVAEFPPLVAQGYTAQGCVLLCTVQRQNRQAVPVCWAVPQQPGGKARFGFGLCPPWPHVFHLPAGSRKASSRSWHGMAVWGYSVMCWRHLGNGTPGHPGQGNSASLYPGASQVFKSNPKARDAICCGLCLG